MELFPNLQLRESFFAAYDIETHVGRVESHVLINDSIVTSKSRQTFALATTGRAVQWRLPVCTIELIVTRPALIPNYWARITDCWAYLWRVQANEPLASLEFVSTLRKLEPLSGGPDPGEHLAAQTWDGPDYTISLGTEGGDALYHRAQRNEWLPQRYLAQATDWYELPFVEYVPDGLSIKLTSLAAQDLVQAQFVTAWAPEDAASAAAWSAVDLDAQHILQGAHGQHEWR